MIEKNVEFKLKNHNDPFAQGFCSFFMQNFAIFNNLDLEDYCGNGNLIRGEKIVVSDHQKCDIGLMNIDTDRSPPEAKIVFSNAKEEYGENEFFFPYLLNARNESLLIDVFEKRIKYNKKYHCIAIFNSHTNDIRKDIIENLTEVCDIVIVDGINIKTQDREINCIFDLWNLMRDSSFCLCPPGHTDETYRFYEALKCHCIPLEFNCKCKRLMDFSEKYIVSKEELEKIRYLEYSEEDLCCVQNNIEREFLLKYLVEKISSYNVG